MKIVIFGLTITSSWGNGHATIWRGLCRSLEQRGHQIIFFEKDVPYYALRRDITSIPGMEIILYNEWKVILPVAENYLAGADAAMVTSYCPDGKEASKLVISSDAGVKIFYDLDTPVTLKNFSNGEKLFYLPEDGLSDFDLVLSYTGGSALNELKTSLGAKETAPLYGSADPAFHKPVQPVEDYIAHVSYLGTYAADRQDKLEQFFIEPARKLRDYKFLIGGSMYPHDFPWTDNIYFIDHIPPGEHPSFYCSSAFTVNVTRGAMAEMGYCPSGRLFEAAACGVPIISDYWEGIEHFFTPGSEIIIVRTTQDAIDAVSMDERSRDNIAQAARRRILSEHTSVQRAVDFENILSAYYAAGH